MLPPERRRNAADLLDLVCELIEWPRARIGTNFLKARGGEAERLAAMGLVRPGPAPKTIACRTCDEDHPVTPEFDSVTGQHFHFCPIAGRVDIEPRDLETLEIHARAIVDLLVAAIPVLPAIGRELVRGKAWHLGEAIVGGTSLTLIFARRIGNQRTFGALARAVATVPATEVGMILTSSPLPDPQLMLPNRYTVIGLRDIASIEGNRVEINRSRTAAHIKMLRGNRLRLRTTGGRPSDESLIVDAYDRRRQRDEPFESTAAEARAIVSDLAESHPDRGRLGVSTVRRHLRKLRSSAS